MASQLQSSMFGVGHEMASPGPLRDLPIELQTPSSKIQDIQPLPLQSINGRVLGN